MRRRTSRELTLSYFRALCSLVKFFDHIRRPSQATNRRRAVLRACEDPLAATIA